MLGWVQLTTPAEGFLAFLASTAKISFAINDTTLIYNVVSDVGFAVIGAFNLRFSQYLGFPIAWLRWKVFLSHFLHSYA